MLATPEEWTHDPWSGDIADGHLWGRGALDMKSQVAAEAVAAAALAREGWRPARGDAARDGGRPTRRRAAHHGAGFLTEQHPDAVRCDWLLNEGGGEVFEYDGRRLYGVCCAEKGVFRFTVTTKGVAGHASIPRMGDNALLKLAPLLERFGDAPAVLRRDEEPRAFLRRPGRGARRRSGGRARARARRSTRAWRCCSSRCSA